MLALILIATVGIAGWFWDPLAWSAWDLPRCYWTRGGLCGGALPGGFGAAAVVSAGDSQGYISQHPMAAITTISAFLVLNLGGLPGLAQLGSLVAIGIALAALGDGGGVPAAAVPGAAKTRLGLLRPA